MDLARLDQYGPNGTIREDEVLARKGQRPTTKRDVEGEVAMPPSTRYFCCPEGWVPGQNLLTSALGEESRLHAESRFVADRGTIEMISFWLPE